MVINHWEGHVGHGVNDVTGHGLDDPFCVAVNHLAIRGDTPELLDTIGQSINGLNTGNTVGQGSNLLRGNLSLWDTEGTSDPLNVSGANEAHPVHQPADTSQVGFRHQLSIEGDLIPVHFCQCSRASFWVVGQLTDVTFQSQITKSLVATLLTQQVTQIGVQVVQHIREVTEDFLECSNGTLVINGRFQLVVDLADRSSHPIQIGDRAHRQLVGSHKRVTLTTNQSRVHLGQWVGRGDSQISIDSNLRLSLDSRSRGIFYHWFSYCFNNRFSHRLRSQLYFCLHTAITLGSHRFQSECFARVIIGQQVSDQRVDTASQSSVVHTSNSLGQGSLESIIHWGSRCFSRSSLHFWLRSRGRLGLARSTGTRSKISSHLGSVTTQTGIQLNLLHRGQAQGVEGLNQGVV